jgi:hypothetical protein
MIPKIRQIDTGLSEHARRGGREWHMVLQLCTIGRESVVYKRKERGGGAGDKDVGIVWLEGEGGHGIAVPPQLA